MYKIVVVSPGNFAPSGGPEALHQLVHVANQVQPGSCAILYEPENYIPSSIEPYLKYNCPIIKIDQLSEESLIVLPEVWPDLAHKFKNKCALWWLSVGFFGSQGQSDLSKIDVHLAQSFYAKRHINSITDKDCLMLTDWIDYIPKLTGPKANKICVNPAKGLDLIDSFVKRNPSLSIQKIQGMSKDDVMNTMSKSKVYIDFGDHPGRDRMPREASLSGCVVFVKRQGAASFYEDVPIDEWFKFDSIEDIEEKVYKVLDNYDHYIEQQYSYQKWCSNNYNVFRREVTNLLGSI